MDNYLEGKKLGVKALGVLQNVYNLKPCIWIVL